MHISTCVERALLVVCGGTSEHGKHEGEHGSTNEGYVGGSTPINTVFVAGLAIGMFKGHIPVFSVKSGLRQIEGKRRREVGDCNA